MEIAEALKVALEFLGKWKPDQWCKNAVCSECDLGTTYFQVPHRIPCPPLTDELAFWCLRELQKRLYKNGQFTRDDWQHMRRLFESIWEGGDPAEAIIQAVAALAAK